MGVAGAGKTTVGKLLATQLGWKFADGDDYHPAVNLEKMRKGIPLTDADRAPWLETLRELISGWITAKKNVVLACSALKREYRTKLHIGPEVRIVYLKGSPELLRRRLHERNGHFMTEQMLESQLAALEEPEDAVTAIVGIGGQATGVLMMRVSGEAVERIAKNLFARDRSKPPPDPLASVAEICNKIAANFKSKLGSLGDRCELSAPAVVTGSGAQCRAVASNESLRLSVIYQDQPISITLHIE